MKKHVVILLLVMLTLLQHLSLAQDQRLIDSLQTQLKQLEGEKAELRNNTPGIRDSSIAKILKELFVAYIYNNPERALDYAKQSLNLSEQIGWKKGIGSAYNCIGGVYKNQGNYPEALKNHFAALKISEEIGDKKGAANSYNHIGNVYIEQGNYPETLKNYFAALKISEVTGDKSGITNTYMNIGNVYTNQDNYPEALKNYFAALKIDEETGNRKGIAACYNNIGLVYFLQDNYPEALKKHFAALKIKEEIGDKYGIADSYHNIGIIYAAQSNYPDALKNLFASLKIKKELGDKNGIAVSYINFGEVYTQLHRAKESKIWLQKGLALSRAIGAKALIKNAYSSFAVADSALGNYKGAFENYKLYMLYKDSLFNEENNRKITQQQMQVDFDKKETLAKAEQEKKDLIAKDEKEKQQVIIYAVSSGLFLVLLLVIFIFRGYRQKQKANISLASKNELIAQQKHLVEEKHKEITDSINYAERIQRSLLASKDLLDQNLNHVTSSNEASPIAIGGEVVSESSSRYGSKKGSEPTRTDCNYFVFFKPKDVVSGDFYWASTLQNNQFAFITADSTGHGVPGAIMSILNIACLNEAVKEGHTLPADILNRTRKEIISVLKRDGSAEGGKDGMDCSLLVFDFKNKKLSLAAANNPVWIVRSASLRGGAKAQRGFEPACAPTKQSDTNADCFVPIAIGTRNDEQQTIEIKPDKMPVGKHDKQDVSFTQKEFDLQSGDVIYTLTDGFPDQFGGPNGKKFMSKNLRELLAANAHLPMSEQKHLLETTFANWVGDLEQVDDVTLIGVRV